MAFPIPANTTLDIYRAGNSPPAAPDLAGVRARSFPRRELEGWTARPRLHALAGPAPGNRHPRQPRRYRLCAGQERHRVRRRLLRAHPLPQRQRFQVRLPDAAGGRLAEPESLRGCPHEFQPHSQSHQGPSPRAGRRPAATRAESAHCTARPSGRRWPRSTRKSALRARCSLTNCPMADSSSSTVICARISRRTWKWRSRCWMSATPRPAPAAVARSAGAAGRLRPRRPGSPASLTSTVIGCHRQPVGVDRSDERRCRGSARRRAPRRSDPSDIPEQFLVLVECSDEQTQIELLQRFQQEGLKCKARILGCFG